MIETIAKVSLMIDDALGSTTGNRSHQEAMAQLWAHKAAAAALFPGPPYLEWLPWLHDRLRPRFYCEIGVEFGKSLALVRPETQAVGIDPAPLIDQPLQPTTKLFSMPSDDFFLGGHADSTLGHHRFDFGFIDGLHEAGQALRDFIHLERYSWPDAVIAMHDVLPPWKQVATPQQQSLFWVGDAFMALLTLTEIRRDLHIGVIPCFPSGLAIVTGLNPQDATSNCDYETALARWRTVEFDAAITELKSRVTLLANDLDAVKQYLDLAAKT